MVVGRPHMITGRPMVTGDPMDNPDNSKTLGQHWLTDNAVLDAIVGLAQIKKNDDVLEIGSGPGNLTSKLVKLAKSVVAVELDESLVKKLINKLDASNLTVHGQDILRFNFNQLPPNYKIVANIPYYLTSNLLRVLCETDNHFSKAVILVQKEVAERVAAPPGKMSLLSVSVQFYCRVTLGPVVPASMFNPPPKVDSQVIILDYRPQPLFPDVSPDLFFRLVKAGFSQRRKTLINSLSAGLRMEKHDLSDILEKSQISASTRPQNLSLERWYKIYQKINPS